MKLKKKITAKKKIMDIESFDVTELVELIQQLRKTNDVTVVFSCAKDEVAQVVVASGDPIAKRKTMKIGEGQGPDIQQALEASCLNAKKFLAAIKGKISLPSKIIRTQPEE